MTKDNILYRATGYLARIFHAGCVVRWHTNPWLSHTDDRIDGHSARVARLILAMHPDPSFDLIKAALTHDDGESVTGDVPATAKNSRFGYELRLEEERARTELWGDDPALTYDEHLWLSFADKLDAYMWAQHHAPHVLRDYDWQEARDVLIGKAERLGVTEYVREVVG